MNSINNSTAAKKYRCDACEEEQVIATSMSMNFPLCRICGSDLTIVSAENGLSDANANFNGGSQEEMLQGIFDLMGSDLREAFAEAMDQTAPSRQISISYLKSLGKLVVDDSKAILRDISLCIGPMKILAVSASFGYLPAHPMDIEGPLVLAEPCCGEHALTNSDDASCRGAIVMLDRGAVSFAAKSIRAVEAGAAAVVIAQTLDIWPFMMTDNAGEYNLKFSSEDAAAATVSTPVTTNNNNIDSTPKGDHHHTAKGPNTDAEYESIGSTVPTTIFKEEAETEMRKAAATTKAALAAESTDLRTGPKIPIVMISKKDALVLKQMLRDGVFPKNDIKHENTDTTTTAADDDHDDDDLNRSNPVDSVEIAENNDDDDDDVSLPQQAPQPSLYPTTQSRDSNNSSSRSSSSSNSSSKSGSKSGRHSGNNSMCCLHIGHAVHECSICQEEFRSGDTVLKLPCRHLYHSECVTAWLELNNTCPLCRLSLPQQQQQEQESGTAAPSGGGTAGSRTRSLHFQNSVTSTYYN